MTLQTIEGICANRAMIDLGLQKRNGHNVRCYDCRAKSVGEAKAKSPRCALYVDFIGQAQTGALRIPVHLIAELETAYKQKK